MHNATIIINKVCGTSMMWGLDDVLGVLIWNIKFLFLLQYFSWHLITSSFTAKIYTLDGVWVHAIMLRHPGDQDKAEIRQAGVYNLLYQKDEHCDVHFLKPVDIYLDIHLVLKSANHSSAKKKGSWGVFCIARATTADDHIRFHRNTHPRLHWEQTYWNWKNVSWSGESQC